MRRPKTFEFAIVICLLAVLAAWMPQRVSAEADPSAGSLLLHLPMNNGEWHDAGPAAHPTNPHKVWAGRDRHGRQGGAGVFGGDGFIHVENPEAFDNLASFTLSAWVKPTVRREHLNIISKVTPHRDFNLQIDHLGRPVSHIQNYGYEFCYAKNSVPLNEWSFVTATYEGGVWKMYIDGKLDATVEVKKAPVWQSRKLTVGALFPGAEGFEGSLDEVKVHGKALSLTEIQALMGQ